MNATPAKSFFKTIVLTGLLAGALDIAVALIMYVSSTGKSALNVLRYIASAIVGMEAFEGGVPMALLGLLFHFIIAYSFTALFFMLYKKINSLSENWVVNGVVYGIIVWVIMNVIVLPLTNVPPASFELTKAIIGATILIGAIGLPVSLLAHKFYKQ